MNKSTLTGVVAGAVAVTALGAIAASDAGLNPFRDYATVVAVEPAFEVNRVPREACHEELVERQVEPKDEKRVAGAVIGAAVGAAGGAIADGGKGAGKGAAIGGLVGAGGGTLYGLNENRKHDEQYRNAYARCMRSRGYSS